MLNIFYPSQPNKTTNFNTQYNTLAQSPAYKFNSPSIYNPNNNNNNTNNPHHTVTVVNHNVNSSISIHRYCTYILVICITILFIFFITDLTTQFQT